MIFNDSVCLNCGGAVSWHSGKWYHKIYSSTCYETETRICLMDTSTHSMNNGMCNKPLPKERKIDLLGILVCVFFIPIIFTLFIYLIFSLIIHKVERKKGKSFWETH